MGKKVFISYKFGDTDVQKLGNIVNTRVRDYVNFLQDKFEETPHIFKAEDDDNDLSRFKDATIESKLRDKIYDSTVTVILISKNMWDKSKAEDEQWIPWEVSYSLKVHARDGRVSGSNALLAVVIPDITGSYEHFIQDNSCPTCKCRSLSRYKLFRILRENMFNIKKSMVQLSDCPNHPSENKPFIGHSSYIYSVKWSDFIKDNASITNYLKIAMDINDKIDNYDLVKE
ncbi:MAG: TIR domain-containing protein [Chitinophagaceae bacterium]|nr:TIR domain-containing protein [Chitinophagaceae bacterium]